jgi:HlyD family secretion protein
VRLDETVTGANLAIVTKGLGELMARKARLESERDGLDTITFPAQLVADEGDPDRAAAMDSERKLFSLRKTARSGQKAQLRERIAQLGEEITDLAAPQNSKAKEIALIERELAGVRELWKQGVQP